VTDAYRHRTPVQVRFRDTDAFGHVNNAVFFSYVELARVRYLTDVLEPDAPFDRMPLILARAAVDFRSPVMFGDEVSVATRVESVGRTSFAMSHRMTADGRHAADVESVLVVYDYETQRPKPVPDEWRARIGAYEGRPFEPDRERHEAAATS
jgi:acyl-CoA thioester hydrolase